jgi:hypothetical protein
MSNSSHLTQHINQYISKHKSESMIAAINAAHATETSNKHNFDLVLGKSPKFSKAGQYYFDCLCCGRSVFDDKSGSAVSSVCS